MEQTTNTKASLPGFISLVKESLQIYRLKWKVFFKIIFVSFGVAMAIMLCFVPGVLLTLPILAFNIWVGITVIIVLTIAEFLAAAYFSSWFGAAMIVVLRDNQEDIGFREAMKRAKPYIGLNCNVWLGIFYYSRHYFFDLVYVPALCCGCRQRKGNDRGFKKQGICQGLFLGYFSTRSSRDYCNIYSPRDNFVVENSSC